MRKVSNLRVVLHHRPAVHNPAVPHPRIRINHPPCHHHRPAAHLRRTSHRRARMHQRQNLHSPRSAALRNPPPRSSISHSQRNRHTRILRLPPQPLASAQHRKPHHAPTPQFFSVIHKS